jgi:hypothetical protein
VKGGEGVIAPDLAFTGHDDSQAGAGDPRLVIDEGLVAHPEAGHVGDGVVLAGGE